MRGLRLLVAMLRADVYRSGAFGPYAAPALAALRRVSSWALGMGALGGAWGWFAPWLPAGADAGPLLSAFITGSLGLLAGVAWGLWRERRRGAPPGA
jgi:hypothetical protein